MIVGALLDMLTALLTTLYAMLPEWSLDFGMAMGPSGADIPDMQYTVTNSQDSLTMALVWMQKYNNFVPFDHLIIILTIFTGFVAAVVGYKAIRFVIGVVRGAGTS